jgi:quercetin dioxygenase-like cupin family protein
MRHGVGLEEDIRCSVGPGRSHKELIYEQNMGILLFTSALVLYQLQASSSANRHIAVETPLMTTYLPDVPGKEGLIETVLLSPGEVVPAHRHDADAFAYVLEGGIITQLKGGKPQTIHTGEVFYESPTDIHLGSRNGSKAQRATLLVFFVKNVERR